MEVTRPNHVWAMDITYIPMARGFVYLAVVLDWFSRRVLSRRLVAVRSRSEHTP
jgi:putative transposase